MKTLHAVVLAGLLLGALPAAPQGQEELRVSLPESHELVEIQPGVQVIPEFDLEIFYTGGAYWLRTDGVWYSARRPSASATFLLADRASVPAALSRLPVGSHLNYQPVAGQRRSQKQLSLVEAPEPEAASVQVEVAPAKPAPAKGAAAKPAPAKTNGTTTKLAPAPAKASPAAAKPATTKPAAPAAKPAPAKSTKPAPKKDAAPATTDDGTAPKRR